MKYQIIKERIWCKLFGHKFLSLESETPTGQYSHINHYRPVNYCVNCGLSKEEIRKYQNSKKGERRKSRRPEHYK